MNGTYREIERRVTEFRARTGLDLGAVWIAPERWNMLPQSVREAQSVWPRPATLTIAGVPVRVFQVLDPP